jgi:hypothetical protein
MENQKQGPHGTKDPIQGRISGNEVIPSKDHCRYGEDPAFKMDQGERGNDTDFNVNQVATPRNPTKDSRMLTSDGFYNHTGAG